MYNAILNNILFLLIIASACFMHYTVSHLKVLMQNAMKVYISQVPLDGIVEIENIVLERCNH